MPRVSVIMPVRDAAPFLGRSVGSVLAQTLDDLELILIDDGSTDDSPALCDAWAARDSRVRVLHQENRGPGPARNAGLAAAAGEYIGFADSDDYALPELYATLYAAAERDGLAAVKCGAFILPAASFAPPGPASENEALRRWPALQTSQYRYAEQDIAGPDILRYLSSNLLDNSLWTLLLRADVCRDLSFPARPRMEDSYFYMDLASRLDRLRLLSPRLYLYLTRAGGISQSAGAALLLERAAHEAALFARAADFGQQAAMTDAFNRLARTLTQYGERGGPATEADLRQYLDLISFFQKNASFFRPGHPAHSAADPFDVKFFLQRQADGTQAVLDFSTAERVRG
ncbi:MAG: glycosyltransferase [Gracilibacteraceae bacterium]|jgi:glycosyltransferase involved in cell wall biosynthesis|nr:glycosyltransferase [Gracilibacteraceae bacterium]